MGLDVQQIDYTQGVKEEHYLCFLLPLVLATMRAPPREPFG